MDIDNRNDLGENTEKDGAVGVTKGKHPIHCLTIIGQVEGHADAGGNMKTTKYEHVIPQLIRVEEDPEIKGLLIILNTVGGDVEAGLAIAELIRGMTKPTASLVLGGGQVGLLNEEIIHKELTADVDIDSAGVIAPLICILQIGNSNLGEGLG